jgi:hypothetical protein
MRKKRVLALGLAFVMLLALVPSAGALKITPELREIAGRFSLSFGELTLAEQEKNDTASLAQPIRSGQTIQGSAKAAQDVDYYSFTLTKRSLVLFSLTSENYDKNFIFLILDEDLNVLRRSLTGTQNGESAVFQGGVMEPGCYYLFVENIYGGTQSAGEKYDCYFEAVDDNSLADNWGYGAGLLNFAKTTPYPSGLFTDVPSASWYASSVQDAYEYGLVNGRTSSTFDPSGSITIAESIALACRIHATFCTTENDGPKTFQQGSPWYQVYVDYAVEKGLIEKGTYTNYTKPATRAEFASILRASLADMALQPINDIAAGDIPDVSTSAAYASAVYRLYRAGVLTGSDVYGTFKPNSNIKRSEVAAILTRMVDPGQRQEVTLQSKA